ncbi:MAG: rRNA maturation RNAse YbeY, partial [Steroidobacteraceae bacterium]
MSGRDGVRVDLHRRVRTWAPPRGELAAWASTALGRRAAGREIGVSVVGPAESRRLNARFRGRDQPTNVLSFPAAEL